MYVLKSRRTINSTCFLFTNMIFFDDLPLAPSVKRALSELKIEYVFQPIVYPDGKTVFAREALMRPIGRTVTDLIEEYTKKKKLHVLEVATMFGATQAYLMRGYTEILSVNSFPCEIFSYSEVQTFIDYFGSDQCAMMIEILEYPVFSKWISLLKKEHTKINKNLTALDDFGSGFNDWEKVDLLNPDIIKIDRSLLCGIDSDFDKMYNIFYIIETAHARGIKIIAEGVETEGEYECLKQLGADLFQGYYFARPE